jgi:hypothetical protein
MTAPATRPTRPGGTRRAGRQITSRARCPHAGVADAGQSRAAAASLERPVREEAEVSDNSQTTNPLQGDPNAAPRVRPLPLPPPQRDPGVSRPPNPNGK